MKPLTTLAVDIETVALPLSLKHIEYLTRDCKTEEDKAREIDRAGLYPPMARLAMIGVKNVDTDAAPVCLDDDNETAMLRKFWDGLVRYDRIVTFNGRGFDVPFIIARSAANGVVPTRFDLLGNRFSANPHCDLLEQFSHYGCFRRFTMDVYCKMFGIDSPKRSGVTGASVGTLWQAGERDKVKAYNADDLIATCQLFKVYMRYYQR